MQRKPKPRRWMIIAACMLMVLVIAGAATYKSYDSYMMQSAYTALREGRKPDNMSEAQFSKYCERLTHSYEKK